MNISAEQVKSLREETGVSVMQCKKALEEARGDREKALIILRKKSSDIASKKSDRQLGTGIIAAYVHNNGLMGALVEVSCETDFVAGNEDFKKMAHEIAMQVTAMRPEYVKREDISDEDTEKVKAVLLKEVSDKPADLQEKILQGKLDAYFKERTLFDQTYFKNPDITISQFIEGFVQKFGERIEISRFERFAVGK
jgi:elongation factor Ts